MKIPLKPKRTDYSIDTIFDHKGCKAVGDEYRKRFGGPPFPITQDKPLPSKWFCSIGNCPVWLDTDGIYRGSCTGHCGG